MKWNKARINLALDIMIGVAFVVEVLSGFVLWIVLPYGGYRGGRGYVSSPIFVLSRSEWLRLHDWFAVVIIIGVVAHIALHWQWVLCVVRNLWRDALARRTHPSQDVPECSI